MNEIPFISVCIIFQKPKNSCQFSKRHQYSTSMETIKVPILIVKTLVQNTYHPNLILVKIFTTSSGWYISQTINGFEVSLSWVRIHGSFRTHNGTPSVRNNYPNDKSTDLYSNQMNNYPGHQGYETIKRLLGLLNRSMINESIKTWLTPNFFEIQESERWGYRLHVAG